MKTSIQLDMFEVQLGAGLLLQLRDDRKTITVLADAGVHASGYPVDHVHKKLQSAFSAFDAMDRRIDLIIGTHYDEDHLAGLVPIINDVTIEIGEAWLPPVANDTEVHAADDTPNDEDLLALQFAKPDGDKMLARYLRTKADFITYFEGEHSTSQETRDQMRPQALEWDELGAPEGDAETKIQEAIIWFRSKQRDASSFVGESEWCHANQSVDLPPTLDSLLRLTSGKTLGLGPLGRAAGADHTKAYIRASAAKDAINAASLAKVVFALKRRGVPIRCATIDDGEPRRFVWSEKTGRFDPNAVGRSSEPELLLLGPSKSLIKRHWDRLPIGTYFVMAAMADFPIRHITPSNELSYVIAFKHQEQKVLVCGDSGCVDFKSPRSKKYYPKLLDGLAGSNVMQVAHHAGNNAHFYRVLRAAGLIQWKNPIWFLLSHAVEDKFRPSEVFARFMESIVDRTSDQLLFTSRPHEHKVRDYKVRIHPTVSTRSNKGDVRLAYGPRGWEVLAHAVQVSPPP